MVYKYCVVPHCRNTSIKTPDKLFVQVPKDEKRRKKWLKLARKDPKEIAVTSSVYFCEDHFDLEKDIQNYNQYRLGFSKKLLLGKSALPSKFYCQIDRRKRTGGCSTSRSAYIKRQKLRLIRECEEAARSDSGNVTATRKESVDSEMQNANELESVESCNEVRLEHSAALIIWDCEFTFVEHELLENDDKPPRSATEEECQYVVVKQEPSDDTMAFTCPAAEEGCEYIIVKEEPIEDLDESTCPAAQEECEYTLVKQEPADDPMKFTCPAAEEVCDRITVKLEQEPQCEENSCEQECEYIQVKDEPLNVEDPSDSGATHWVSSRFW